MGWLFTKGQTRAQLIARLTTPWTSEETNLSYTPIRHCTKGNNLWSVWERSDGHRFLALDMMKPEKGYGWGYKGMDESSGPAYVNCPLAYLDLVPDPGYYATEWRERVRAYWAAQERQRATAKAAKCGDVLTLVGATLDAVRIVSNRNGTLVGVAANGRAYRIPMKMVGEIVQPA